METCDRCGPAVSAQVTTPEGLTFCQHHARQYGYAPSDSYVIDNSKVPDQVPVSDGACTVDPNFTL